MFFGEAVGGFNELFGLLATHPPLVERIRRLDPSFNGDFSQVGVDDDPTRSPADLKRACEPLVAARAFLASRPRGPSRG